VARNVDTGGEAPDCTRWVKSEGYNLFGSADGCDLYGSLTGVLIGVDPIIDPLGDNGGPTPTHALLTDSPAIDAGGGCSSVDQRGVVRPKPAAGQCDMGAYEFSCGDGVLDIGED
jgi:hypothetical protein